MSLIGADTFKWEDQDKRLNIMFRMNRNIKYGDNIVVREDEIAVFYRDGKVLTYIDRPDRYALTDLNAPIVGKLVKFLVRRTAAGRGHLPPEEGDSTASSVPSSPTSSGTRSSGWSTCASSASSGTRSPTRRTS